MARYSLGVQKAAVTAAGALLDIATTTTDRGHIVELGVFTSAAGGTTPVATLGLFRSTAVGTRTTPTTVLAEEVADPAGTITVATAFSVAPTLAANPMRRFVTNAVAQGVIWTWPEKGGLSIPVSGSVVLNAIAVSGTTPSFTFDCYVVVDE